MMVGCNHDENTEGTFYVDDILITDEPMISSVGSGDLVAPVHLLPCFPNPFNPRTTIFLDLDRNEPVRLEIFDVTGRRIKTLHDGLLGAGSHTFSWDGRSDGGLGVGSGSYFCRLVGSFLDRNPDDDARPLMAAGALSSDRTRWGSLMDHVVGVCRVFRPTPPGADRRRSQCTRAKPFHKSTKTNLK